ncbi:MAG: ABC transporter ATP-binding protein [Phycisphaerales bacterium]|nr:ABC transporter ATP-binding protein [Phycisphaerales bacterium]MCB9835371.1 ABC transporter ATP-binding protein [Phycisphaera sp.]
MMLACEDISVRFGRNTVLGSPAPVSLTLAESDFAAIIGPNGSGKSTLLRTLCRLQKPTTGRVLIDGKPVREMATKDVARVLALVAQSPPVPHDITVLDLVAHGRYPHRGFAEQLISSDRAIVESAIARCDVEAFAGRRLATLSGGERQRAWIAAALAQEPRILLLDEPTSALDIRHQLAVMDLLRGLNERDGITIGIVVHDINLAARACSRIVAMRKGQIVADGKPSDVITPDLMREVFGVETEISTDPATGAPVCRYLSPIGCAVE